MKPERLFVERHGFAPYIPSGEQCSPQLHVVVDWYAGAHSDSLRAAHCGGCVRPYGITSQMAIYRYKRSVLVDFIIERPLFPSDWARACRDWLLPPMVALPHACLPVRWWIRFAAVTTIKYFRGCRPTGKSRRLKRATGTFLRAGFRIHST